MKTIFTILFAWMICISIKAQDVVVYKTYEDFQNKVGEKYQFENFHFGFTLVLLKAGQKVKISSKNMWGFTCGGALFMLYEDYPYRVLAYGTKLCYYEDGSYYMYGILNKSGTQRPELGANLSYVSKTLQSKMVQIHNTTYDRKDKKGMAQLRQALTGPEYKSFFDCLNGSVYFPILGACAQKFEQ